MAEFAAETVAGDLPVVAITMGDPAGVGPEVAVKALHHDVVWEACRPLLVGDPAVLEAAARICGSRCAVVPVAAPPGAEVTATWDRGRINVVASGNLNPADLCRGEVSAAAGAAGYQAIAAAIRLAQQGAVAATVTAPIHKEALNRAGHHFAGQTEIYANLTGTRDYAMLLMAGTLRVVHVSTHVSLREACERVTRERVETVIRLAHGAGQLLGLPRPRIGVAGLNPHASDGGLFGCEEGRRDHSCYWCRAGRRNCGGRTVAGRHPVPEGKRRILRPGGGDVPRPGPHPYQGGGLRLGQRRREVEFG